MDRQPVLTGQIVTLRPLTQDDWEPLFAVASDPAIWAMHPAHDRWQEPVFRSFFADALAQGGGLAVIDNERRAIVGSSRFQRFDPAHGGSVEVGWTFLARSCWGQGHNREMKRLMLSHALATVARVDFRVGEENWRSRRALEKIGARFDETREERTEIAGREVRHVCYTIDRAGFANGPLA